MENAHIYRIVSETLHQFKTSNPFELCAMMDVNVRYADLGSLKGMYKYIAGNAFIIINSSLDYCASKLYALMSWHIIFYTVILPAL